MRVLVLWLLLSLSLVAEPLKLRLLRYEGSELDLRVEGRTGYYLQGNNKLAGKTLSDAELRRLQRALTQSGFSKLPAELVQATCDSFDRLTVARTTVRATDVYAGPRQAEFKRFRLLVSCLRELFPPPGPGYCQVDLEPAQDALVPGESIWIFLRLTPLAGWHTYWLHPGESGMASEIRWQLPPGFQLGTLQWSLPQRFEHEGMVTYGYEEAAVLRQEIRVPLNFSSPRARLKAAVSWLACDAERCLPGSREVELMLPVRDRAHQLPRPGQFPQPLPGWARAWREGQRLLLEAELPDGEWQFFPGQGLLVQESVRPEATRQGNRIRLSWVAFPTPQPRERLQGLLCVGEGRHRRGYWVDVAIGESAP